MGNINKYHCKLSEPTDCIQYIQGTGCRYVTDDGLKRCTYAIEVNSSFFLHDPELNKIITAEVNINVNHEFPHDIAKALEFLKFEKKELRYYGKGQNYNSKDAIIEFGIDGECLMCKDITNLKPLFIVNSTIGLGYFLVLLQSFGIFHDRYTYERVDGILEQFIYSQEDY